MMACFVCLRIDCNEQPNWLYFDENKRLPMKSSILLFHLVYIYLFLHLYILVPLLYYISFLWPTWFQIHFYSFSSFFYIQLFNNFVAFSIIINIILFLYYMTINALHECIGVFVYLSSFISIACTFSLFP